MKAKREYHGKTVFIAGGSSGLGKSLAMLMAAQGAHVTIFARRQKQLDEALREIIEKRRHANQDIRAVSLDLTNPFEIEKAFKAEPRIPDILYLVAGGTNAECGYFTDMSARTLETCMNSNYFTAAYPAQALLKIWVEDDKKLQLTGVPRAAARLRQIIFINSAAALCTIPGYAAYSPTKAAVRALADTLRMEAIRLSNAHSTYKIHIAFPSNFLSAAFIAEQTTKPELTKQMESTTGTISELERRVPTTERMAEIIMNGVEKGDFAICDGSLESEAFWANMVGTSPKRGLGVWDSVVGLVVGWVVWPVYRRVFDGMCRRDGMAAAQS